MGKALVMTFMLEVALTKRDDAIYEGYEADATGLAFRVLLYFCVLIK